MVNSEFAVARNDTYLNALTSLIAIISERCVFQGSERSGRQALSNKRGKTEKSKKEKETRYKRS